MTFRNTVLFFSNNQTLLDFQSNLLREVWKFLLRSDIGNGEYTEKHGNNGKIQDTRNYKLLVRSRDMMVNLTTVQRMYWSNCAN